MKARLALAALVLLPLMPSALRAQTIPRQQLSGQVPDAVNRLAPAGRLDPGRELRLAIGLPLRHQAALSRLLERIYDPASADYHHYLTPGEFAEQFGPTPEDYRAVADFVSTNGLIVTATHPNRTLLEVAGPVAAVEKMLHIKLGVYRHPTEARDFFAPDTEPSLDLNVPLLHISGLDDFSIPRPMNLMRQSLVNPSGAAPDLGSGPGGSYLGNDFRAAYLPTVSLTGTGQTVALVEFNAGYNASDITAYENLAGQPSVPVSTVLLDGYSGALGSGNGEVSLDIEMAIAMAPGLSRVVVYEGSSPDDILNRIATDDSARQISASWTYDTDATSEQIFQQYAAQGQSFFNASGDGDAWVGAIGEPSDDTYITIVGGTSLKTGPSGNWSAESAWNDGYEPPGWPQTDNGFWGTGGGISTRHAIPVWQQGISMSANKGSATMRNIPDVALTAVNIWETYSNGLSGGVEGTSCAAPLWAGLAALINQQAGANGEPAVGFINPAVYAIGKGANYTNCFHDTVFGNNTTSNSPAKFFAVPGYDLCTGWGTPAGEALINALAPEALGVTPVNGLLASGPVGGPFAGSPLVYTLTNRSAANLNWGCLNTSAWLTVTPTSGILAAGKSASVTVSTGAGAGTLAAGVYPSEIWFTNHTDGVGQGFQNQLQVNPAEDFGTYDTTVASFQPAAWWPLNETLVPPAADVVTNSGSLGLIGNGFPYDDVVQGQAGIVGNCVAFANTNLAVPFLGTHVDVPFNAALNPKGPFTVEFWAKPNQAPNDYFCPVSSLDDSENTNASRYGWVFYEASGNQWVWRLGNYTGYIAALTGGTVQPQVWQHVAGVYDGANVSLYVNGVKVAGPTSASGYGPNTNQVIPLRVGATSFGNRTFDGSVDELAVFTNALSAATIYAHYRAAFTNTVNYGRQILTANPLGYWRFDEPYYAPVSAGQLPTAFNLGSLSYLADGTYQAGCVPGVAGVADAGFGTPSLACAFSPPAYIDVPGGTLGFSGPVTVTAWVKAAPANGQIESVASLGAASYQLTMDGQGHPHFVYGQQPFGSLTVTNRIDDGQWHQLAGVYDGTNRESLFLDGQLAASAANATVAVAASDGDFWIGGDPDPTTYQFFSGAIAEVAVFPSALSTNQILWLYSSGYNATLLEAAITGSVANTVSLKWAAIRGQKYQVESSTNLAQANWSALGGAITATNSTLGTSDSITNGQRFYRVVLVP